MGPTENCGRIYNDSDHLRSARAAGLGMGWGLHALGWGARGQAPRVDYFSFSCAALCGMVRPDNPLGCE